MNSELENLVAKVPKDHLRNSRETTISHHLHEFHDPVHVPVLVLVHDPALAPAIVMNHKHCRAIDFDPDHRQIHDDGDGDVMEHVMGMVLYMEVAEAVAAVALEAIYHVHDVMAKAQD